MAASIGKNATVTIGNKTFSVSAMEVQLRRSAGVDIVKTKKPEWINKYVSAVTKAAVASGSWVDETPNLPSAEEVLAAAIERSFSDIKPLNTDYQITKDMIVSDVMASMGLPSEITSGGTDSKTAHAIVDPIPDTHQPNSEVAPLPREPKRKRRIILD